MTTSTTLERAATIRMIGGGSLVSFAGLHSWYEAPAALMPVFEETRRAGCETASSPTGIVILTRKSMARPPRTIFREEDKATVDLYLDGRNRTRFREASSSPSPSI